VGVEWALGMMLLASSDLGFERSVGVDARLSNRYIQVEAGASYEPKHNAASGVTWAGQALLTLPVKSVYVGAGYATWGYRSEFKDGSVWEKRTGAPIVALGYRSDRTDIRAQYTLEDPTYATSCISLDAGVRVHGAWSAVLFGQRVLHQGGAGSAYGVGIRFRGGNHNGRD
jgi:hypothetical protein